MMRFNSGIGALVWLIFLISWRPQFQEPRWIIVLLLFSPLALMPFSQRLWDRGSRYRMRQALEVPSACLLALAFVLPPGWWGAWAASAWLIVRGVAGVEVVMEWWDRRPGTLTEVCLGCAKLFPAIGASWIFADRAGWNPLGFDSLIILLTAAHFHHAGFTLPLIAGLLGERWPGCGARFSMLLILAGVPLVAAGITLTHFTVGSWVEPFAAIVLVSGSLGVAVLQMRVGLIRDNGLWVRASFLFSGLALMIAMILAAGYGLRSLWTAYSLPMPAMWAVHGSLNVFGFGLVGLVAWRALFASRAEN